MAASDIETELRGDFAPLMKELGFAIVELHAAPVGGRMHLELVIYRAEGVSIDDCARVHKVVRPRAELILDDRDLAVQVASPGIDRTFKSNSEFQVFIDQGVRVLLRGADEWIVGVVESTDDRGVTLRDGDKRRTVTYDDIQKARLDYSQEVK